MNDGFRLAVVHFDNNNFSFRHTADPSGQNIQPPFFISSGARQRYNYKRWANPGSKLSRLYPAFTTQDLHQPLALTSFPGNIAHGPHSAPAAPV